jgi:hypothetical protein
MDCVEAQIRGTACRRILGMPSAVRAAELAIFLDIRTHSSLRLLSNREPSSGRKHHQRRHKAFFGKSLLIVFVAADVIAALTEYREDIGTLSMHFRLMPCSSLRPRVIFGRRLRFL